MRWIGFGLTLLIATLLLADLCFRNVPERPQPTLSTPWRRTAQGWQHVEQWAIGGAARGGALHPLVLTAGLLLGTLWVLVAFSPDRRFRQSRIKRTVSERLAKLQRWSSAGRSEDRRTSSSSPQNEGF